jgi:hypothetical protein
MRQISLAAITVLLFTGCSENESPTFARKLQQLGDPPEIFPISNEKADTIQTKNGTVIIIQPHTFVSNDGQDPKESIQIEVREVFNKSDMILNGIGTVSDGRLLESFGMIYLAATSDNNELHMNVGRSMTVSVPNKREGGAGELFYGVQTDNSLTWKYAGTTRDTTEVVETIVPMSGDIASVKRTTYKYVNGSRDFVSDTVFSMKYECCQDQATDEEALSVPDSYRFQVTKLGWINCDRFIEFADKVDLEIELKKYSQPIGYLVFPDINSIMQVLFDAHGTAMVNKLPDNYPADLIVIDQIKENFMWTQQQIQIGSQSKLSLETKQISDEELKRELKLLDK